MQAKEKAASVMRMFIDACQLNPPSRLPCSKAQSDRGVGNICNRETGETFIGIRLSEATPHCL